ncbi:MAG TPA: hypothetical protein VNA27_07110 [Rubrobacteraceae bacterium]|nr:hypothetical protein [Rubrobacteraceae bacterium]
MGLKEKIGRLKRAVEGHVNYIELADGSRFFYEPEEVGPAVFKHGSRCLSADYRSEPRPDPPEILEAVARARDRRAALEQLYEPDAHLLIAYEIEALVERGELVPRSFLAGHSYEESVEYFAQKNTG